MHREAVTSEWIRRLRTQPAIETNKISLPTGKDRGDYMRRIDAYLDDIRESKLQKAILSRVNTVPRPENFDPVRVFEGLCTNHGNAFVYLLLHPLAGAWMGASPELLLQKQDHQFTTMALAATQPADTSHHYHWRTKEKREHEMVGKHIETVFEKFHCKQLGKNGPQAIEAGTVAHLRTSYVFEESSALDLKALLRNLHPTPAVGGYPSREALQCILQHEGYDRRYYCGFIGETDFQNRARLYVNLRCMQVGNTLLAIYCGGGITADSDPEEEWEETVQKSKTMMDSINSKAHEIIR